eukprot:7059979-Ditylum_brightwellii.AAC.1
MEKYNCITKTILQQVDSEGFTTAMIEGIIDQNRDETTTVHTKDKYVKTYSNQRKLRKSTIGWKLQVLWKDKSELWMHLKDIKNHIQPRLLSMQEPNALPRNLPLCGGYHTHSENVISFYLL